tara:strand:- start:14956 stop:15855 length:900 start_codon:yes stop_codon:yes gene_type:complete
MYIKANANDYVVKETRCQQHLTDPPKDKSVNMTIISAIQFLGNCTQPPRLYGVTRDKDYCPLKEQRVAITNARTLSSQPQLDTAGYTLIKTDQIKPSTNMQSITQQHVQQSLQLLRDHTGASDLVLINSVIRRSEQSPGYLKDGTTLPARFAHNDFGTGQREIERWVNQFATIRYDRVRHRRIATYNTWRMLTPPPTDVPLALCDASSLSPGERVGIEFHEQMPQSPNWVFEMSGYHFNPAQRWSYFPDLKSHELLVFKGFDSDASRAELTPHAAFTLPDCPADTLPRESIESRFLAFF